MNNIEFFKIELENKEIEKLNSDMIGYKKKINKFYQRQVNQLRRKSAFILGKKQMVFVIGLSYR